MELFAAKSINISKLLVLCPPGTIDPTPHLYDTTMYTLSGLMTVAVIAHGLVKPVTPPPGYGNSVSNGANISTSSSESVSQKVIDTTGKPVIGAPSVPKTDDTIVGDRLVNK
jgi:hypothetical protein